VNPRPDDLDESRKLVFRTISHDLLQPGQKRPTAALTVLLHLSEFSTFFFSLNDVAPLVYSIVGAVYILLSIAPLIPSLIDFSSPFKTPISNLLWRTLQWQLIQLTVLCAARSLTSCISLPRTHHARRERYHGGIVRAIEQDLESTDSNSGAYALRWRRWAISSVQYRPKLSWNHSLAPSPDSSIPKVTTIRSNHRTAFRGF
jgi:hypothetical protein